MDLSCGEAINSFALVSYVPEPLAAFIEGIRQEAEPGCRARSHLTFLPPRPIDTPLDQVRTELETILRNESSFRVSLGDATVFPVSQVVHLAVRDGSSEARRIHDALHRGPFHGEEAFEYHPHVTLAQDLNEGQAAAFAERAQSQWRQYSGSRDFLVDHLTLVRNTVENCWINLGEFALKVPVSV
jgi:2'-5' RNA ligase